MLELPACLADRFRVGAPIGHGAIAEVVRAVDQRSGAEVALKVLYPALRESEVVVQRFRREVDLCRRIQHRHVLAIHDVVDSDGHLFLVMDYHPGGDLAERIARQGRLAPDEIRLLACQLGGALGAAHRVGIVHRDVKPSNVLAGAGADLDVRLCDFGLARSAEGSGLTTSTAVLGTPEYMAPEVIAEGHADPRSDLYSLGVVLFEAATGRLPFVADSPYQLMRLALQTEPPRARDLVSDLPPDIDAAISRALEKDPLDRFASAAELVDAFASARASAPETQGEPGRALAAPAPSRKAPCPACGGWLIESAGLCTDCGHEMLRLEHDPAGVSILVTGPEELGDKLEARRHVDLYRLLGELPDQAPRPTGSGGKALARAPRVPFYVARHITLSSAERLLPRLQAIGLEARIERGWALKPKEIRKKVNTMAWRIFAGAGFAGWGWQFHHLLPDHWVSGWTEIALFGSLFLGLPTLFGIGVARSASRPLVTAAGLGTGAGPPGQDAGALAGLITQMRGLGSRQDRRLLARIHERLLELQVSDAGAVAGAAARAVEVAGALGAVDAADRASAAAPLALPAAQAELRRLERGRVLLRAELLRLSSHLEALSAGRLRAGAGSAGRELAAASSATSALELSLESERELEEFLGGGNHPRLEPA